MKPAFVPFMRLIAHERIFVPQADAELAACVGLWELGLLTVCPPGHRYKLSATGLLALEHALPGKVA